MVNNNKYNKKGINFRMVKKIPLNFIKPMDIDMISIKLKI